MSPVPWLPVPIKAMQTLLEGATFPFLPKTLDGIMVGNPITVPPRARVDFKKFLRVVFIQDVTLHPNNTLLKIRISIVKFLIHLFVVIHVEPSKYFKREGINVFTELEILPAQAVLGDVVTVKTLDGEKEVQIPAGIQHGDIVKIKGAGIPIITKPSQRGDHIVIVKIKIPVKISEQEKRLYEELYSIAGGKQPQKSILSKVKGVFK